MKTGIFIDLDGTLLNDKKKISKENFDAINMMKDDDRFSVYLITGKSLVNTIWYYDQLNLRDKLITSSGQIISNPSDNKIFNKIYTEISDLKLLFKYLFDRNIMVNFLIEKENSEYIVLKKEESYLSRIITKNHKLYIYKININYAKIIGTYIQLKNIKKEQLNDLVKNINKEIKNLHITYWLSEKGPFILQVTPKMANKGLAIKSIKKEDKLSKVISIGDGWIDVSMFKTSDYSFAMKNAAPKIKTFVDEVTKKNNNDSGVAEAIIKIVNIS